ncbi:response regulator transcription factor [Pseudonocardia sp.]|uniref:response regulator n=1 Tax=Pseudonocardia sp. TaxID=60912 RepID=UPI00260F72E3|nr:response regulator transcription factor [Pseudonocardia sp.]
MNEPADRGATGIRVLLVDDQELLRVGLRMVLDAEPGIEVVGDAADGHDGVHSAAVLLPDVTLMDIRMPSCDGIEATRRIVAARTSRVLIMTTFDLDAYVVDALRAGASGFLLKDAQPSELVAGIRAVAAGDAVVGPGPTRRLLERFVLDAPTVDPSVLDQLTMREREVLSTLACGLSNAEIASALHVSETTVKSHVARIFVKLELRDRVQAVVLAYETGLVRPGRES